MWCKCYSHMHAVLQITTHGTSYSCSVLNKLSKVVLLQFDTCLIPTSQMLLMHIESRQLTCMCAVSAKQLQAKMVH